MPLRRLYIGLFACTAILVVTGTSARPGNAATPVANVNFQAQTTATPSGYSPDYGQAFDATRGYGWENAATGAPLSLVGNGRERNVNPDKRLDTLMQMQLKPGSAGVTTPGKWELVVPNGVYTVTVGVGDPSYADSHDVVNIEGVKILDFTPTTTQPQLTTATTVTVNDGRLTLDANGGTNTKIDYIDVTANTPPPPDTTPPTVTITPSGTTDTSGNYVSSATVTIAAADEAGGSGVKSTTYTLDGGTPQTYASPFTVTTVGSHTVTATATDNAGNVSSVATATFSVVNPPPDITPPTVTITPSGTTDTSGNYVSSATVTIAAADEAGGSGVKATTYTLDGGTPQTYSAPFTITTVGSHTVTATATDNAGNVSLVATTTFSVVAPPPPPSSMKVNFQAQTTATPSGYSPDYGQAFDATRGYGWENAATGAPLSLVGNGRERNVNPDKRLDTLMQMQLKPGSAGVTTPGKWELVVPNGVYTVTVGVGDPSYADSHDVVNIEGVKILDFTPTTTQPQLTTATTVTVNDGRLTLDANGGTNTKIDYIDVTANTPPPPDTTPPTVTITPSGTTDTSGNYVSSATVTIAAADEAGGSGVKSTTYTLDGGTPQTYASPFTVTTVGSHTVTATATDNAGNVSSVATATFSVVNPPPDITPPTVTITPSGTTDTSGNYVSSATVTIAAADEAGGSGVKATTYTLDGGTPQTYSAPFTITTVGSHTVTATATDNAGNVSLVATTTFSVVAPPPPSTAHVNFQAQTTATPSGYSPDYGQAFDATRGYGWEDASTGAPLSRVGNGRERNVLSDKRLDTLMQMQLKPGSTGVTTPGTWELVIPNGAYSVTIAVGDPSYTDSHDVVNIEGSNLVDFTPTTSQHQLTVTANVTINDGRLTLDANGGTNTKVDYIDVGPPGSNPPDPVIAAAGDIACSTDDTSYFGGAGTTTACGQRATSNLLVQGNYAGVLALGDNQYNAGELSQYQASFDPTWGRVKPLIHPDPGNHEYLTSGASGYFSYFGSAAGTAGKGYYSFDVGTWHIIALNSECGFVSCAAGSTQETWLKADLASHSNACTLAFWHHPRFSSGENGNDTDVSAFFQDLYAAHAELVLSGHDHNYERFAPQDPSGNLDTANGVRQFVVGTGGQNFDTFHTIRANSTVRNNNTFGILQLTLHPNSYDWKFIPVAGSSFTDAGTTSCH